MTTTETARAIADERHRCARSNIHDYDGCGCSDIDLLGRALGRAHEAAVREGMERAAGIAAGYGEFETRPQDRDYDDGRRFAARATAAAVRAATPKEGA